MSTAVAVTGFEVAGAGQSLPATERTRVLYERYGRRIFVFCYGRLRNRSDAEDASQRTFLNAHRALQAGIRPSCEGAWLYAIAGNVCLGIHRESTRRPRVVAATTDELVGEAPGRTDDRDRLFDVAGALRTLPDRQRRALLLREWQGLSYREIADELGVSQAAVETLLFRARRSLAASLDTPSRR